jgi:hypothetical protein
MSALDEIKRKTGVAFRPAAAAAIAALRALGVSDYRQSEPSKCMEIGKVRRWPIANILEENKDYVPGHFAQPCGYVVFSTTIYGDAYCFDTSNKSADSTTKIVLIAHDLEPENDEMKREDLAKLAKPIAASFEDFLKAFVSESLDIKPLYPSLNFGSAGDMTRP